MLKNNMEKLILNIAGFNILLVFRKDQSGFLGAEFYKQIKDSYEGFIIESANKIDFKVTFINITNYDVLINKGREKHFINFYNELGNSKILSYYHISLYQFQVILRVVLQKLLAENNGLIFHASACLVRQEAYIFLGKSGAGKSTFSTYLAMGNKSIADDMVVFKKEKDRYYIYEVPFREKNYWEVKTPGKYILGKMFFLRKIQGEGKIVQIEDKQMIINNLTKHVFTEKEDLKEQMQYLLKFATKFNNFYYLDCSLKNLWKMVKLVEKYEKV